MIIACQNLPCNQSEIDINCGNCSGLYIKHWSAVEQGPVVQKMTLLVNNLLKFQNMPIFFVEKNVRNFCIAKVSRNFSNKKISVFA